jgi:BirA family biotin operon repressor/biotin-[acetyl-CoA-carboxylase] ligase
LPLPCVTIDHSTGPSPEICATARSLHNLFPSWDFRVFGAIDSTSSAARRMALTLGGDAWPRVFLADDQSEGRGRNGSKWESTKGESILATVLLPPSMAPRPMSLLWPFATSWVAEGISRCGIETLSLKWPNDVLVNGRKIAGVLCERAGDAVAIGVGVNVAQTNVNLPEGATSLAKELGDHQPAWLSAALTILTAFLESVEHPGTSEGLLASYRNQCVTIGTDVDFPDPHLGRVRGRAEQVNASGHLVVNVAGLGHKVVSPGGLP